MPKGQVTVPDTLSGHARDIYRGAFSGAYEGTCKERSDRDACAAKIAWAAVKNKYRKNAEGEWVKKSMIDLDASIPTDLFFNIPTRADDPVLVEPPGSPSDFGQEYPTPLGGAEIPIPPNLTKQEQVIWSRAYQEAMEGECAQTEVDNPRACASAKAWESVRQHRANQLEGPNALSPEENEVDKSYQERREYSQEERERMAKSGAAMPHGGFPVANCQDVQNAVQAIGRAKDRSATITHIVKRARALDCMQHVPEKWLNGGETTKSLIPVQRVSEAWLERTALRAAESMADEMITTQVPWHQEIDRPDYVPSDTWNRLPLSERTLGAEMTRRQVERNYHQAVDNMVANGWNTRPMPLNPSEYEFRRYVQREDEVVLERAILVRHPSETQWQPLVVSQFAQSSSAIQTGPDQLRYKRWGS